MNLILLKTIQLYWNLIPEHKRRKCLFRESCSHYVYRTAKEKGFFSGCKALFGRVKKCRPGYELFKSGDEFQLRLKDGSLIPEKDIALSILPYSDKIVVKNLAKRRPQQFQNN